MVDWDTVLTPEALGLEGKVHSIATTERVSMDDVPYVEATVVLPPGIPEERLTWDLVAPIHSAVWDCIASQPGAGRPHVRFITLEDSLTPDDEDPDNEIGDETDVAA